MDQLWYWLWQPTFGYGAAIIIITVCALSLWIIYSHYQRHLDSLVHGSPLALLLINEKTGELVLSNQQAMQLLGIRLIGNTHLLPDTVTSEYFRTLLNGLTERNFKGIARSWPLSNHESVRIEFSGRKVIYKSAPIWLVYAIERQATNEEHKQELITLSVAKTALNSLSELIYIKDNHDKLLATNRAFDSFWLNRSEEGGSDIDGIVKGRTSSKKWTTTPDGCSCLLETNQNVLMSEEGKPLGTLYISHDVTDWHNIQQNLRNEMERRKNTEVALAQRDTILQNILESSPDSIGIFHENMVYQACNEPFVAALGIPHVDDLIGKRLQDVIPDKMYNRLSETDRQVLHEGKSLRYIDKVRSSTGLYTWYDVVKSPFHDPASGTNGVLIMARDISERYLAEQKLEEANLELERLSFIDSLTQVSNRRRFDEQLSILWPHHAREKMPISIMLCDIDYFKGYNDHYGHQQGDDALVKVADAFKKVLNRSSDCVARYGGEEFAFILPSTTLEGAKLIADRIHSQIEILNLEHEESLISDHITISIGLVSCTPKFGQLAEDAIASADKALYQAKASGRNQTCVSSLSEN